MFETIVRLTDEQEQAVRRYFFDIASDADIDAMIEVRFDMARQVRDALALYDQLVAEAKANSDD